MISEIKYMGNIKPILADSNLCARSDLDQRYPERVCSLVPKLLDICCLLDLLRWSFLEQGRFMGGKSLYGLQKLSRVITL